MNWTPTSNTESLPPINLYVTVSSRTGIVSMMYRARHGKGGWSWHSHGKSFAQDFIVGWMYAPKAMEVPK